MINPECIEECQHSLVAVRENGMSAVFNNPTRSAVKKIHIDDCVVTDSSIRADYVVEVGRRAVVVELKGRGVERACKQIFATANMWKASGRCDFVAGLIVAKQYPRSSTSVQISQLRFQRVFGTPMHVVTHNASYDIDHVFSFKGPFRS